MEITINIHAPELVQAINHLAAAFAEKGMAEAGVVGVPAAPIQSAPMQQPMLQPTAVPTQTQPFQQAPTSVPTAPMQQPAQQPMIQQPFQQAPQSQPGQAAPTTAHTYSQDQLAVAATQLMDAGRQNDLFALLASFGIQALTQLPQEQYGAFATKLREMGARI